VRSTLSRSRACLLSRRRSFAAFLSANGPPGARGPDGRSSGSIRACDAQFKRSVKHGDLDRATARRPSDEPPCGLTSPQDRRGGWSTRTTPSVRNAGP
jgi:hypothetical protein